MPGQTFVIYVFITESEPVWLEPTSDLSRMNFNLILTTQYVTLDLYFQESTTALLLNIETLIIIDTNSVNAERLRMSESLTSIY